MVDINKESVNEDIKTEHISEGINNEPINENINKEPIVENTEIETPNTTPQKEKQGIFSKIIDYFAEDSEIGEKKPVFNVSKKKALYIIISLIIIASAFFHCIL